MEEDRASVLNLLNALHAAEFIDDNQFSQAIDKLNTVRVPVSQLLLDAGSINEQDVAFVERARSLLERNLLTVEQLSVFMVAQRNSGIKLANSVSALESFVRPPVNRLTVPPLVNALIRAQLLGTSEVSQISMLVSTHPEIPVEEHLVNFFNAEQLAGIKLGAKLLATGEITESQFCVSMFDQMVSGKGFEQSLKERGWWPNQ